MGAATPSLPGHTDVRGHGAPQEGLQELGLGFAESFPPLSCSEGFVTPGRIIYLLPCERAGLAGRAFPVPAPRLLVPEDTN